MFEFGEKINEAWVYVLLKGIDSLMIPQEFFHKFLSHKNVELAEKLINAGAQVNAFGGPSHSTPLHLAASYEDTDMVRLLLEYGADPYKKDGDGKFQH